MNKVYRVILRELVVNEYIVEATNEDEAKELACSGEFIDMMTTDHVECEVVRVVRKYKD